MSEFTAHPLFQHPNGDQCIWIDTESGGYWFVPLDAGGEGYACEGDHPCYHPSEPKHAARPPHPNTMAGRP
jgi:hypothetical protein